jgi:hypothetical protein
MKEISLDTRLKMSESAKNRCTAEWRLQKSRLYETKLNTVEIKELYESGMTQDEIAEKLGVTQKVIWRHMMNYNIPARKAAKRDQKGEKNSYWKGDNACYSAFHRRLEAAYGRPKKCAVCKTTDKNIIYDWANLTGRYEDINDYKRMCRSCHRKHDKSSANFYKKGVSQYAGTE